MSAILPCTTGAGLEMLIQWYPPFKTPTQAPSNNVLQKGVVFGQGFIKPFTCQKEGKGLRKTGLKWPMLFSCAEVLNTETTQQTRIPHFIFRP